MGETTGHLTSMTVREFQPRARGKAPAPFRGLAARLQSRANTWVRAQIGKGHAQDRIQHSLPRVGMRCPSALTFEVRGGRNAAKLHCGRPLDRRVRELVHKAP